MNSLRGNKDEASDVFPVVLRTVIVLTKGFKLYWLRFFHKLREVMSLRV